MMVGGSQIGAFRVWSRLGPGLWVLSLLASAAMAAIGVGRSDILISDPWTSTMIQQGGWIALGSAASIALSFSAERYLRFRMEAVAIGVGLVALIATFGLAPVALVAVFLASAGALGVWICDRDDDDDNQPLVIVATVGAAVYSLLFTVIAPIRINTPAVHGLLTCAPVACAVLIPAARQQLQARLSRAWRTLERPPERTAVEVVGLAVLLFILLLHAFLAALPERYWDAMAMHLYLPSYLSAHAAWDFDAKSYAFAFMPTAVDWMYANFFLLGGEQATRLYNLTALLSLSAVVVTIVAREASREVAIWIAALFVSLPLAFIETGTLFIENTLTLWITTAVAVLIASGLRPTPRHAIVVLILLAASTMAKLHGALAAALIGILLVALVIRQGKPIGVLLRLLLATVALGAIGCFPYIYAWIWAGNPLFPFYNDLFKSPFFPAVRFADVRWMGHLSWSFLYDATFASSSLRRTDHGCNRTDDTVRDAAGARLGDRPTDFAIVLVLRARHPHWGADHRRHPISALSLPGLSAAFDRRRAQPSVPFR